jgi:hypothetical protein
MILGIAIFFIKRTWDLTKRNQEWIKEAIEHTKFLKELIGTL